MFASTPFGSSGGQQDRQSGQSSWGRTPSRVDTTALNKIARDDLKAKRKERHTFADASSIVVEKGPYTMIKEDVLDLCARNDIFLSPDDVTPVYRRDSSAVLLHKAWRLVPDSAAQRAAAFRIKNQTTKVVRHPLQLI